MSSHYDQAALRVIRALASSGIAALPPSVRNGSAFPERFFNPTRLRLVGGIASREFSKDGKAEPSRTEGGKAARPEVDDHSTRNELHRGRFRRQTALLKVSMPWLFDGLADWVPS